MSQEKILLITGVSGHLGKCLLRTLAKKGLPVRGLVSFEKKIPSLQGMNPKAEFVVGDISKKETLVPFFAGLEDREAYRIHGASVVDIQHEKLTRS